MVQVKIHFGLLHFLSMITPVKYYSYMIVHLFYATSSEKNVKKANVI